MGLQPSDRELLSLWVARHGGEALVREVASLLGMHREPPSELEVASLRKKVTQAHERHQRKVRRRRVADGTARAMGSVVSVVVLMGVGLSFVQSKAGGGGPSNMDYAAAMACIVMAVTFGIVLPRVRILRQPSWQEPTQQALRPEYLAGVGADDSAVAEAAIRVVRHAAAYISDVRAAGRALTRAELAYLATEADGQDAGENDEAKTEPTC